MIQSLGHMAVTVRDMPESVRFYTRALGMKKAFEISHPVTGALQHPRDDGRPEGGVVHIRVAADVDEIHFRPATGGHILL